MAKKIESYEAGANRLENLEPGSVLEAPPFWVIISGKFCPWFSSCSDLTGCVEDLFKQCASEVEKTGTQIGKDYRENPKVVQLLNEEFKHQFENLALRAAQPQPLEGKKLVLLEKPEQLWAWSMDVLASPPAISTYSFHVGILNENDDWKAGDPHVRFNIGDDSRYCCVYTLPTVVMDGQKKPKILPVNIQHG